MYSLLYSSWASQRSVAIARVKVKVRVRVRIRVLPGIPASENRSQNLGIRGSEMQDLTQHASVQKQSPKSMCRVVLMIRSSNSREPRGLERGACQVTGLGLTNKDRRLGMRRNGSEDPVSFKNLPARSTHVHRDWSAVRLFPQLG